MPKDIEELKMIVDLAKSDGKKEAENEMLKTVKKQLEDTCAKQQKMLAQKDKQLAESRRSVSASWRRWLPTSRTLAMVSNPWCLSTNTSCWIVRRRSVMSERWIIR